MSRLPIIGQDDGVWGQILNDYLLVSHNADGTEKTAGSLTLPFNLGPDIFSISDIGNVIINPVSQDGNDIGLQINVPSDSSVPGYPFLVGTSLDEVFGDMFIASNSSTGASSLALESYGLNSDGSFTNDYVVLSASYSQPNLRINKDSSNNVNFLSLENEGSTVFSVNSAGAVAIQPNSSTVNALSLKYSDTNTAFISGDSQHGTKINLRTSTTDAFIVSINGSTAFQLKASSPTSMGFYGVTPVAQQPAPTTLSDVIIGLQNLGLFAQDLMLG